jgi:uncharacterized protein YbaP (TraB family)
MLWTVENTPHHVLGSIHALPDGVAFPDWVFSAYQGSHRVVFEADHTAGASFLEIGVDRNGAHLADPEICDLYERARALLLSVGNDAPFDGLRPWRANMYVTFSLLAAGGGVSGTNGVEMKLRSLADSDGLAVGFLEKPGRAFELFDLADSDGSSSGARMLEMIVRDPEFARREYFRILNAWLTSDRVDLADVHREKLALFPTVFEAVITQRNREWMAVAAEMLASDIPTLFVVGSMHTVGPNSFIDEISNAGFQCTFRTSKG